MNLVMFENFKAWKVNIWQMFWGLVHKCLVYLKSISPLFGKFFKKRPINLVVFAFSQAWETGIC